MAPLFKLNFSKRIIEHQWIIWVWLTPHYVIDNVTVLTQTQSSANWIDSGLCHMNFISHMNAIDDEQNTQQDKNDR